MAGEMDLLIIKFVVSVAVVLLLSFIAEHISPKWAGLLSGFPTGSAITLYFFALENNLVFAAESAVYNIIGLVALQMSIYGYYKIGGFATKFKIFYSLCGAIIGYLLTVFVLSLLPVTPVISVVVAIFSFVIFRFLFRNINHSHIAEKIKPTLGIFLWRAGLAALTICLITAVAKIVSPAWAGLLSAFPTTLLPLLLIIHFTYGEKQAHAIIKHVPEGLGGLLIYSLIIHLSYPKMGLYSGMALAFSGALGYLLIYQVITLFYKSNRSVISDSAKQ